MDITGLQLQLQCQEFLAVYPKITWALENYLGLPQGLLLAVGSRETNLSLDYAANGHLASPSGGYGVWQLTPSAAGIALPGTFDVTTQAIYAGHALAQYISQGVDIAANAYNAGHPTSDANTTGGDYGSDVAERLQKIQTLYPSYVNNTTPQTGNGNTPVGSINYKNISAASIEGAALAGRAIEVKAPKLATIPGINPGQRASAMLDPAEWKWPYNHLGPTIIKSVTTESNVDLTIGQIPQVQLTVVDLDLSIYGSLSTSVVQQQGQVGQLARWRKEVFAVSEVNSTDVDGVPCTIITLSSAILAWMQVQRSVSSTAGSATQWLEQIINLYNVALPKDFPQATFFGQQTATRGANPLNMDRPRVQWLSYFDYATQLASQEGFWLFETNGGLFFGSPKWVYKNAPKITVGWPGISGRPGYNRTDVDVECMETPVVLRSQAVFTGDTMTLELPRDVGEQMRCGQAVTMVGVPTSIHATPWVVQQVNFAIDGGATPVEVICNEAKQLVGTEPGGQTPRSPTSDPTGLGNQNVSAAVAGFVSSVLSQAGDAYSQGQQIAGVQFDCSGLVQWACEQNGITFPRDTYEQWAYLTAHNATIPLQQAIDTRGALLYAEFGPNGPGHVAISLGDGTVFQESTYGQPAASAPVGSGFFTAGARIPGLNYAPAKSSPRSKPSS